jgi:hypothetical protein
LTSTSTQTSARLHIGIHSLQKTGGLFNETMNEYARTDWSEHMISQQISPSFIQSPIKDTTDFLFPVMCEPVSAECDGVQKDILQEFLLLPPQSDIMADNIDFCEVFTDIENLIALDSTCGTPSCIPDDISTIDLNSLIPITQDDISQLHTEHQTITTSPDHSYSTSMLPSTTKRRFSELTNFEDEESEGTALPTVPVEVVKRTKYLERRKKNNIASKRSREMRKNKFLEMDGETTKLEQANEELRKRIELLENLTKKMKEALVAKLSAAS